MLQRLARRAALSFSPRPVVVLEPNPILVGCGVDSDAPWLMRRERSS